MPAGGPFPTGTMALQNANAVAITNGVIAVQSGNSASTANVGGRIFFDGFPNAGNVGAAETNLKSYTLALDTLDILGRTVEVIVKGTTANNGNAKLAKFYVAGNLVATRSLAILIVAGWEIRFKIYNIGTNQQRYESESYSASSAGAGFIAYGNTTLALNTNGTILFQVTGQGVANDDVINTSLDIRVIN